MDETWLHHSNLEANSQTMKTNWFSPKTNGKTVSLAEKVIALVSFHADRLSLKRDTTNSKYYMHHL